MFVRKLIYCMKYYMKHVLFNCTDKFLQICSAFAVNWWNGG